MANLPWSYRYYDPMIAIIKDNITVHKMVNLKTRNALAFKLYTQTGLLKAKMDLGLLEDEQSSLLPSKLRSKSQSVL